MSVDAHPVTEQLAGVAVDEPATAPVRQIREFDPSPYLRQLGGRGGKTEYLDVRHRLLWLRTEHPDAEIVTELIRGDEQLAIFRASVVIPNGGSATGHGSETATDFSDYIEKAETKALGRALNALGFGAQFAEGDGDEHRRALAGQANHHAPNVYRGARQAVPRMGGADRGGLQRFLAEMGFESQAALEEVLGQPIKGLRPGEIRELLKARSSDDTALQLGA